MKKTSCFLFTILVLLTGIKTYAQHDPKAEAILNEMSKKYKSIKAFKADFSYVLESPSAGKNETITGEIFVKGEKFKIKLGNQEVINNGTTVWTFLKEENEVNVSNYEPDAEDITPNNIYTIYQKGYKYLLAEETASAQIIDLVPEDKSKKIFKIRITVSKKDKSIKSWKMFEKTGNRYVYNITKFSPNPPGIDDKFFIFDKNKHKGVEVVDLR
ncbi:MAG TPA: cell envelope biogenesis protein LolA [Cytophagales bacterium]|jgi:outer membrane lipoprotein carrier protein|nr:cell envelope biogenesis protein LolA [Cytophagales bacterium]